MDGQKFKVLSCELEFHQVIDHVHQKPERKPAGGLIQLTIEAQQGDDIILSWMQSNTMTKSGAIVFYKSDSLVPMKTIIFKTAYCVNYKENFNHENHENLKLSFTIASKEMSVNGITHKNTW